MPNLTQLLLVTALLSSLCSLSFAIVGGRFAKPPPPDDPVVFTQAFNLDSRCEGFRNPRNGIYSFLGIHYAEPPIGELRYSRPVYKRMAGDMNATNHGPPCIQPDPQRPDRIIGDENCLLLNVYTPRMPDESTGLPVLLWIHPGGYRYGSAAQYDATPMAQQGVVVVAPQYRLGTLGLLGDGTREFDGNLAMFDLALALRWVNDYIKYFGGDPKRVQAIGHGSGAASAMYLSMSPTGRSGGGVQSVVAMSGSAMSQYALDKEPVQSVQEIALINGCPTGNELEIVNCMRAKSAEEIILNDSKIQTERLAGRQMMKGLAGGNGFQPHIEGLDDLRGLPGIIKEDPEQMLRNSQSTPVPLLTGVTKHETGNAVSIESITRDFGSPEGFLGSLTDVLMQLSSFLSLDKAGNLLKADLPGLTKSLTPSLQQFLSIPNSLDVTQVLSKVVDSSTDVLFSLPAVLTTQVWSQLAPAFMYSFEHNGTKSSGVNFLRGMPVVAEADASKAALVTHGDELGYMFDVNDIFGNPMPEANLVDDRDLKVRKNFIGMLVEFAKSAGGSKGGDKGLFKSVTGKSVPFIKIDQNVKSENNFRFCELSMLGASLAPLGDISCAGVVGGVLDTLGGVANLGGATNAVGGLLGGGSGGSGTKKPSGGVLGGLGLG